jgi:CRP-like cAMP-binding protein
VDVSQWKESTIHHLGELGPGGVLGEISLLGGGPAAATIFTRTKCWLLALDRRTFREVIMTHPQVLAYLSELAGKRLGQDAFRSGAPAHDERRLPLL